MIKTIQRTVSGHSWITGTKAPAVPGWVCFFVSHFGTDRTVYTYKRGTEIPRGPVLR